MKLFAIRGATTIETDSVEEIETRTIQLIEELVLKNRLFKEDVVSLIATTTSDIHAAYPVRFIRESKILGDAPVFSALEPDIDGGLHLCIRVLLHVQRNDTTFQAKHAYLHGAAILRKDLK